MIFCRDSQTQSYRFCPLTVNFSHMLAELKAIYPNGQYGHNYKITKVDAAEFWRVTFGPQMIVPWLNFKRELNRIHPMGDSLDDEQALKHTINLTQNEFISKFEFDIFTRLVLQQSYKY